MDLKQLKKLDLSSIQRVSTPYDLTPLSFSTPYDFPRHFLPKVMKDDSKIPLVLVACGSFSPITYLHLRMFEMAQDHFKERNEFELLTGYYSPVSDYYMKEGLAKAQDRVKMCQLAVETTSDWLMVDSWEARQEQYQRTAVVLDHFDHELNTVGGGIATSTGERKKIRIMLLAGGDLIASFGHPGVWAPNDLHHIVGHYGCVIIERTGTDVYGFLLSHDILYQHRMNVTVIKQLIHNDISSTKIRLFVKRGMSIKYLLPNPVIDYIHQYGLYLPQTMPPQPPSTSIATAKTKAASTQSNEKEGDLSKQGPQPIIRD